MPLTGLVAAARRRTSLIEQSKQGKLQSQASTVSGGQQTVSEQLPKVEEVSVIKQEVKRELDFSGEIAQAAKKPEPCWQDCKHLKQAGERAFCKRYMTLCAKEKCNSKYINGEEKQLDFKRILRGK